MAYALKFGTKPEYVLAVAHIESRKLDRHDGVISEFRIGKMGRYWGPMGLRKRVPDMERNIAIGTYALRDIQTLDQLKERLHDYNREFNGAYWWAICQAVRRYSP